MRSKYLLCKSLFISKSPLNFELKQEIKDEEIELFKNLKLVSILIYIGIGFKNINTISMIIPTIPNLPTLLK